MLVVLVVLALGACGGADETSGETHAAEACAPALAPLVRIAPEAIEGLGIVIGEARAGATVPAGTIPAEVVAEPSRVAQVAPLVAGRVERVAVVVGDEVEPGAVLATLASAQAADLTAAAAQAGARVQAAEAALERARALRESGVVGERAVIEAQTELDTARAQRAGLSRQRGVVRSRARGLIELVAPIGGHVTEVRASPGAALDAGEPALVIVDTRRVWAVGHAPEVLTAELAPGASARLRLFAYGAERWAGSLAYVAPVLDPITHTLATRIELANDDGRLRPGLLGVIELAARDAPDRVSVPREAVVEIRGTRLVFTPTGEPGVFATVPVAVEREDADEAVIASGLDAGAPVVVEGAFVLESELLRSELEEDGGH